jgi:hypothetical protein
MATPTAIDRSSIVRRLFPPEGALDLAVFRISVAYVLLRTGMLWDVLRWSRLSPALRVAPIGFGWISERVPIDPRSASVALVVFVGALIFALVGLHARIAFTVVTLLGVYLLGIPQLGGQVWHMHHLLWFSAVLAASPCSDALSVDAWRARRRGQLLPNAPSIAYAVPLTTARVLIAIVFFFPGLWKLREAGIDWAWSDNLRNLMYSKWFQTGGGSWWQRIDRWPTLVRLCACAAIVFELSFLPLVFVRRARIPLLVIALTFHAFTSLFLRIEFSTLWWCYGVFIDWSALKRRIFDRYFPSKTETPTTATRPLRGSSVFVGVGLVVVNAYFGFAGIIQGWPFACYPTFQYVTSAEIRAIDLEAVRDDGSVVAVPRASSLDRVRAQQMWAVEWNVINRPQPSDETMRGYLALVASMSPTAADTLRTARSVRVYRAWYSTIPEDAGKPALRRVPLGEITAPVLAP